MSKEQLRDKFAAWYRGEYLFTTKDEEPAETLPEEKPAPKYHNRDVGEQFGGWQRRSGEKAFGRLYNAISVIACICLVAALLVTVAFLPAFGDPDNPANNEVPAKYIEEGVRDTGATNIVAGMILDYRAFDTFGESCVLFIAVCGVLILLRNEGTAPDAFDTLLHEMEEPRHDIILKKASYLLVPMIMLFGIYVVMNGHISPGGGFSGGAIIGAALILYASSYGTKRARRFFTYQTYQKVVSVALIFYALVKGYSFYTGANHIPGMIPLGTPGTILSGGLILPLNIAVALIVSSTIYVFYVLFSKGEMQ